MLDLYKEYEYQEDIEADVLLEAAHIAVDKAIAVSSATVVMYECAEREAEAKLLMESADIDELSSDSAVAEKKGNIFKRAWDAICSLIDKIKTALFGKKKTNVKPTAPAEIDKETVEDAKKLSKLTSKIKQISSSKGAKRVAAVSALTSALVAAGFAGKKAGEKHAKRVKIKTTAADLEKLQYGLSDMLDATKAGATKMSKEVPTNSSEAGANRDAQKNVSLCVGKVEDTIKKIQMALTQCEAEYENARRDAETSKKWIKDIGPNAKGVAKENLNRHQAALDDANRRMRRAQEQEKFYKKGLKAEQNKRESQNNLSHIWQATYAGSEPYIRRESADDYDGLDFDTILEAFDEIMASDDSDFIIDDIG